MKNSKIRLAVLSLAALCSLTSAYAQITPLGDSYTDTAEPTKNFGSQKTLNVDGTAEITYIQFNLASIPAGASVSQATLKLYVNGVTTAGSFNVDYVNGSWSEGMIDASNAPPLGTAIASNVAITTADKNQYILINVTPAVQTWLNGSETNNGIALVANSTFNATFDSKESTTTSHPPELDIVFAGDGTVTSVGTGTGLTGGPITGSGTISLVTSCASGQILQWNGTSWVCSAAGTGTVTSVGSGTGLKGGPITGSGTLTADSTVVAFLGLENQFTASQNVNGTLTATNLSAGGTVTGASVTATGTVSGGEVSSADTVFAANGFYQGSGEIAYGNKPDGEVYLGYSGNGTFSNNDTAIGVLALSYNTSGQANTAVGISALGANTTGAYNTAIGSYAGATPVGIYTPITGSYNTAVGFDTFFGGSSPGTYTNATAIGALAEVDESNALVLGQFPGSQVCQAYVPGCGNTFVGISTTTPAGPLHINGPAGAPPSGLPAANSGLLLGLESTSSYKWIQSYGGPLALNPVGQNVGIGTTAPRSALDVEANVPSGLGPSLTLTNNGGTGQVSLDFNTYQVSTTGTYNPSSRILSADNGNYSDTILFLANKVGAANNGLQDTMSIDSSGDVHVYGNLTKQSGSFMIDHPHEPANKYLYHSFVESPDMMNIYNGVATLDARGSVWITLPEYFEALNQDFRYQLTSIGRPQPSLYVAREISGNRFRISGGKPGGKVSWQVTGIRHDAYADAHRIKVEVEKPPQEQGRYLHPELFGAPAEQAIGYHAPPVPTKRPAKAETADVSPLKTPPVSLK